MKNVTKEQLNEWYKQALEINEQVYNILGEALDDNDIVVYNVNIDRWNLWVSIRAYVGIDSFKAPNELSELVGRESVNLDFNQYTNEEKVKDFIERVKATVEVFARRAGIAKNIVDKNKENN